MQQAISHLNCQRHYWRMEFCLHRRREERQGEFLIGTWRGWIWVKEFVFCFSVGSERLNCTKQEVEKVALNCPDCLRHSEWSEDHNGQCCSFSAPSVSGVQQKSSSHLLYERIFIRFHVETQDSPVFAHSLKTLKCNAPLTFFQWPWHGSELLKFGHLCLQASSWLLNRKINILWLFP